MWGWYFCWCPPVRWTPAEVLLGVLLYSEYSGSERLECMRRMTAGDKARPSSTVAVCIYALTNNARGIPVGLWSWQVMLGSHRGCVCLSPKTTQVVWHLSCFLASGISVHVCMHMCACVSPLQSYADCLLDCLVCLSGFGYFSDLLEAPYTILLESLVTCVACVSHILCFCYLLEPFDEPKFLIFR